MQIPPFFPCLGGVFFFPFPSDPFFFSSPRFGLFSSLFPFFSSPTKKGLSSSSLRMPRCFRNSRPVKIFHGYSNSLFLSPFTSAEESSETILSPLLQKFSKKGSALSSVLSLLVTFYRLVDNSLSPSLVRACLGGWGLTMTQLFISSLFFFSVGRLDPFPFSAFCGSGPGLTGPPFSRLCCFP